MNRLIRPRLILVTRKTSLEILIERHGTVDQARFYLRSRGEDIEPLEEIHARFASGLADVHRSIPADQRRVQVDREALDRFLFAPDDIVVIVGQDGLVPNTAKYLNGQTTIGVNPDPVRYEGVLCPHPPTSLPAILGWIEKDIGPGFHIERRVMAIAEREDGQHLLALNEIFIGHRSHQSARYRIRAAGKEERHSSSGVICATGTGASGWARSIANQMHLKERLPDPEEKVLAWFVREPWPSVYTGASVTRGLLRPGRSIELRSEMGEGGVIFADGIESDHLEFLNGHMLRVCAAEQTLNLLMPDSSKQRPAPRPPLRPRHRHA